MVEQVSPVPKGIRVNRLIPQAASALDRGPEIVPNAAMEFHPKALSSISTDAHFERLEWADSWQLFIRGAKLARLGSFDWGAFNGSVPKVRGSSKRVKGRCRSHSGCSHGVMQRSANESSNSSAISG
jgi:hypothetical protein